MRNNLLTYSSFVIASLVVIAVFITTTTYAQLGVATLLYPILAFFAYKILTIKQRYTELTPQAATPSPIKPEQATARINIGSKIANMGIADIDKRVFLKLIGGAGITLFLFSIFNKRAEGLFFKNLPSNGISGSVSLQGLDGNKIDPAQKKALDDYSISDIENNVIIYYGFISKDRSWYIMRVDTKTGTFRYTKAGSNYFTNWNNRANLKYDFFDNVF